MENIGNHIKRNFTVYALAAATALTSFVAGYTLLRTTGNGNTPKETRPSISEIDQRNFIYDDKRWTCRSGTEPVPGSNEIQDYIEVISFDSIVRYTERTSEGFLSKETSKSLGRPSDMPMEQARDLVEICAGRDIFPD